MFDFIADLDAYFCEKYANYDKLCVIEGYKMPKMHASEVRADGRTYAYTLPANTMRLATQENKTEILKKLKAQMQDKTFSFSFIPLSFFAALRNKYGKNGFLPAFKKVLSAHNMTTAEAAEDLDVLPEVWKNICSGKFVPSKNLLFTMALTAHFTVSETEWLLALCGYELDYAVEKDVVISYLLSQKVFNGEMIKAALAEYKVENLFFKAL